MFDKKHWDSPNKDRKRKGQRESESKREIQKLLKRHYFS